MSKKIGSMFCIAQVLITLMWTFLGIRIVSPGFAIAITADCNNPEAPYDLVKTMRASFYVLGPFLSRFGYAKVSMPGGCAWGPRPINFHIDAIKQIGAKVDLSDGYILAKGDKLKGGEIVFPVSSVGATGNAVMAAVKVNGITKIINAAMFAEAGKNRQLSSLNALKHDPR